LKKINSSIQPQPTLHFWFTERTPKHHYAKDVALDEAIRARFGGTLEAAARCELFAWRTMPEGLAFLSEPGASF
jgi:uncharacterized protein (DUF924 family)